MAKKKLDENQMDLFKDAQVFEEKVELTNVSPEATIVSEKATEQVVEVKSETGIRDFLIAKEENIAVAKVDVEIAGQELMTREQFINSVPVESRFVSLSTTNENEVLITQLPEDGSLNLKILKEKLPNYVTQLQKLDENTLIDSFDNIALLEKLEKLVTARKMVAIKDLDLKQIDSEISLIDKLESGDLEIDDTEEAPTSNVRKKSLKI